ncbi:MAG: PadR family transcriptional regulator [Sandarakinorhabdus sp.]|jgi:DNA-binding PadR family transcriptional regulator|nr:PadR family transcriptional regulator [Sandarakinorhabdus sp.]
MHFRFHFDHDGFRKEFSSRSRRWSAFARAFADEFGDGGDGPRPDGPRPNGPRRRRRFGAEALKILILHLLKAEPRHGYDLIKAIEAMSAGLYAPSPGMIYPLLNLLADEGLIEELPADMGRRRYAITNAGHAALDAAEAQLREALERLAEMARDASDEPAEDGRWPLEEVMYDLRKAVRKSLLNAVSRGGSRSERTEAIAAILRDAAETIRKL